MKTDLRHPAFIVPQSPGLGLVTSSILARKEADKRTRHIDRRRGRADDIRVHTQIGGRQLVMHAAAQPAPRVEVERAATESPTQPPGLPQQGSAACSRDHAALTRELQQLRADEITTINDLKGFLVEAEDFKYSVKDKQSVVEGYEEQLAALRKEIAARQAEINALVHALT